MYLLVSPPDLPCISLASPLHLAWQVNPAVSDGLSMTDVVKEFKPTCLLGLAAQPAGLFTEEMCRAMVGYCDAPIIMPMSNPTAKAECTPAQAYAERAAPLCLSPR
jgi:malic enzyme